MRIITANGRHSIVSLAAGCEVPASDRFASRECSSPCGAASALDTDGSDFGLISSRRSWKFFGAASARSGS